MLNGLQRLSFVEVYDRGNRHVLGMFLAMALLPARRDDSIALPPRLRRQFGPRPSSSGPGRRPFTAKTGVRFPLGAPTKSRAYPKSPKTVSRLCPVGVFLISTE